MKMYMDFVEIEVSDETILWTNGRMVDGEGRPIESSHRDNDEPDDSSRPTGEDEE